MSWTTTVILQDPVSQESSTRTLSTPGRPDVQVCAGMLAWSAADGEAHWWPLEHVREFGLQQR